MVELASGGVYDLVIYENRGVTSCQARIEVVMADFVWFWVDDIACDPIRISNILSAVPAHPALF